MLRNSLRRVLPVLAVIAVSVTLMGCPPPESGTRDTDTGGSNTTGEPEPEPEAPPEDGSAGDEEANEGDSAQTGNEEPREMGIVSSTYGSTQDGKEVTEWTLTNANGMRVQLMDYGASVLSVEVPDRDGNFENVTLWPSRVSRAFEGKHDYFGATVGRYANRIALGKFELDGTEYTLATNNGPEPLARRRCWLSTTCYVSKANNSKTTRATA